MDTPLEAPLPSASVDPPRRSLVRLVHDRNPFFLLSALSMFVGFRIVLQVIDYAPGNFAHLLQLIVILNVYEAMLIGLGLFLIVRRGMLRDGWILLTIEALFLVDLTNLNAECFIASPHYGSVVGGVCFLLAMVKILVIVRTLGLRLSAGTVLYVAGQLAFLFALPGIFRMMTHLAHVTPLQVYGVWWMTGLLIVAGSFLVHRPIRSGDSALGSLPWRLYIAVPLVSLIVHLAGENRVYGVHFDPANVAPVLLALVVALHRSPLLRWNPSALGWSLALVVMAIVLSLAPTDRIGELNAQVYQLAIAPLRLTLCASAVLLLWIARLHRSWSALGASVGCGMFGCLGSDVLHITENVTHGGNWSVDVLRQLIPQTPLQWGYAVIAVAFVLLGIGAVVSLRKHNQATPDSA